MEFTGMDRLLRIARDELLLSQLDASRALARGFAHEIKNPLGGLRGAAQLLQRELTDPSHHEYTDIIIREADRLHTLVDRLLGPNSRPTIELHNVTPKGISRSANWPARKSNPCCPVRAIRPGC